MPGTDYLPKPDADFAVWLQNFTLKITTVYNTLFGLTPAQVTAIQNDSTMAIYLINQYLAAFKTGTQDRVAYKDLIVDGTIGQVGGAVPSATIAVPAAPVAVVAPGVKARVRLLVKQIKANANYTAVIGEDLGIVAPDAPVIPINTVKPKCSALSKPGNQIVITWTKGAFEGVAIESKRAAETTFTFLDKDLRSPFVDTRPTLVPGQPEVRSYRLWYLQNDAQVGVPSDTLTVTTIP